MKPPRRTKIIATIGPATETPGKLEALIKAGLELARLNMSHATAEFTRAAVARLRTISAKLERPVGIIMDIQGPAIRTGDLPADLELKPGDIIALTVRGESPVNIRSVGVNYDEFTDDLNVGDTVILDNGNIRLKVREKLPNQLRCEALTAGMLGSRRHINLPGVCVKLPALTEKDLEDVQLGIELGVDFFAMSFVREAADIRRLRDILEAPSAVAKASAAKQAPKKIIAKLENQQGLANLDEIIAAADAVMVARGDLGIECAYEELPIIQHRIIRSCLACGKPVIVATHMLESMVVNPAPTRAEVSDVATAVSQQADAIMLSGETSIGRYPVECFAVMDRVARRLERRDDLVYTRHIAPETSRAKLMKAACELADDLGGATPLVVFTRSGSMAATSAWFRPRKTPIYAFTDNPALLNQLTILWGVQPFLIDFADDPAVNGQTATRVLREKGLVSPGGQLVVVSDIRLHGGIIDTIQMRSID